MRGTPQTHLLAFSFLGLLSKVRGARAPTHTAGFRTAGGGVNSLPRSPAGPWWAQPGFPPGAQTAAPGQPSVCPRQVLLTEPQLLPRLNGHNVREVFVKILLENPSEVGTGPGTRQSSEEDFSDSHQSRQSCPTQRCPPRKRDSRDDLLCLTASQDFNGCWCLPHWKGHSARASMLWALRQ